MACIKVSWCYHLIPWYLHSTSVRKWLCLLSVLASKHNKFSFGRLNTSMSVVSDVESLGVMREDGVR